MEKSKEVIDAYDGRSMKQIGRLQRMPYEIKLSAPPAGFAAETCEGPGEINVYVKGLFTSESGPLFYKMLDGLTQGYLDPHLSEGPRSVSNINYVLVIVQRNLTATVYVDELVFESMIQPKRSVKKGEGIVKEDIADVADFKLIHPETGEISIGNDEGVYLLSRVGWKQFFYFDLEPLVGKPREVPFGKMLAACWTLLTFDEVFRLTETDFKKLFDIGWFPFVGILGAPFENLSNAITDNVDPTKAIERICDAFDSEALDKMLKRFESYAFLEEHIPFLETGIERLKAGDYLSSVHVVWPRIEGLMRKLLGYSNERPSQRKLAESLRDHVVTNKPFSQLYLPVRFCEYLLAVYFKDFVPTEVEVEISRHSLAHGTASSTVFSKHKALIGLLIVEQIAYYTSRSG